MPCIILKTFALINGPRKMDLFFLFRSPYTDMAPVPDDELIREYPDILQVHEVVGLYTITVRDVEVPLKIKIMRSGSEYWGIANLAVREKGAKEYYRDTGIYSSKEAALHGAVTGFFRYLTPGASIREIKNWGI